MIDIEIDMKKEVAAIEKSLGSLKKKAPSVLAKAINVTAKEARTTLAKKAQESYAVKGGNFNKAMKVKKATAGHLTATLHATGSPMEIKDFKVSPGNVPAQDARPDITKGKVLKSSGMKVLQKGNLKAFIAKFKSGHVSVVQRKGPLRLPLKKLLSPAIPQMLGSEHKVYGVVKPQIEKNLQKNIGIQIEKLLAREAAKA
ncbi:MAG: hypothetical protein CVU91_07405 [Firmicutes bacterium HGW-Firmicutes-16]|nr:MAG: hypothetical protein CVU91_07405 [Firmicutes bacterium HGW-Firmicutes-16]